MSTRRVIRRPAVGRQQGFILVTGLMFLVVLTMLGLSLFRSTGLMDRITANTRDKQRSFESAQAALAYGEWWLSNPNNNGTVGTQCTGLQSGDVTTNIHVCSNPLPNNVSAVPFPAGFTVTPTGLQAVAGGGTNGTSRATDINYTALPGFYIEFLGMTNDPSQPTAGNIVSIYQVSAYGYGGNADTATIVRSTYKVTPKVTCLGCL